MWTKVKTVLATVWADIADTYKRTKVFLLGILALAIYIEWQKIKTTWLVKSGQAEVKSDNKQDSSLAKAEASDNQQADALIKKAQNEPNPGDDWNTK